MRKNLSLALLTVLLTFSVANSLKAQSTIEIEGVAKPAVRIDFNANDKNVKDALEDYFEKMGHKWRSKRGLYSTTKTSLPQLSPNKMDLFFSIHSTGRGVNELTTLFMGIKPSVDMFIGDTIPADMFGKMNEFVKTLPAVVAEYVKQKEINKLTKKAANDEADRKKAERKATKQTNEAAESKKKLEEAKKQK